MGFVTGLFPQRDFDFLAPEVSSPLRALVMHAAAMRPGLPEWLEGNWPIWARFRAEADKVRASGREHYAARTIAEFLRHQTALREPSGEFKLNNNVVPMLARLYMAVTPGADGFFELRGHE